MRIPQIIALALALAVAGCNSKNSPSLDSLPQNTPPSITDPGALAVDEGVRNITTLTVTDAEGNPFTLSLSGDDAQTMSINNSGLLSFVIPTDFENPLDANRDNIYEVTVTADDTYTTPSTIDLSVEVLDVEGDTIPMESQNVTTDDTTFVAENIISSFEFPVVIQALTDRYDVTGVFADPAIAQQGWNNLESPDSARIGAAAVTTCEIAGPMTSCDGPQGSILIKNIEVTQDSITFLMSGGNGGNSVGVEVVLASNDSILGRYTPDACTDPVIGGDRNYAHFDTVGLIGETINVRIFDEESDACGFLSFDHFYQTPEPRGPQVGSLTKPLPGTNVTAPPEAITGLIPQASFENPPDMIANRGWVAVGAFDNPTATSWQGTTGTDPAAARLGDRAISTCEMNDNNAGCDAPVGSLTSPQFQVTNTYLNFLMAGGDGTAPVGLNLTDVAGNVIHTFTPATCGPSFINGDEDWTRIDMSAIQTAFVKLQVFDNEAGGCGFVSTDHYYQADAIWDPTGTGQDGGVVALTPAIEATLGWNVTLPDDAFVQVIGDFDDATTNNWTATGDFGSPAGADAWQGTSGAARVGLRAVSTCELNNNAGGCDAPTGTLTSPAFMVDAARPNLNFLMGGGNGTAPVGLRVLDMSSNEIASFTPNSCGPSFIDGDDDWVTIDLTAQVGNMVQIEIFDNEPGGCGFVSFDHVHMSATAK